MSAPVRVAYMTGEYLRTSPFVFIHREIAALRQSGVDVATITVRDIPEREYVSRDQRTEAASTYILVPLSIRRLIRAHGRLILTRPTSYLRALRLAWQTRQPGLRGLLYQLAYLLEAGLVGDFMRRKGIRHLHNHLADSSCTVAMLAAEMDGFTFSFTLHGPSIFFEPHRWRLDAKFSQAAFVACISNFCRSQAMIWAPPDQWDRLKIVHCGINARNYRVKIHSGKGTRLIFVGRLSAVKGVGVLLDSVAALRAKHPDIQLVLAGDGPDRTWVENRAKTLGIADCVSITGFLDPSEIAKKLADADVFVMASFAEGVPVVLMEAMASGLPVVATHIAGIPELVEHGVNGFLAAPGNADELITRIEPLMDDAELRNRFGQAGRAKVEGEFDAAREAAKLRKLFEQTLEAHNAPEY